MEDLPSVFSPGNPFGQSQLSRSHYHPSSPQRIPQQQGKKVVKPGQCQLPRPSLPTEPPLASQDAPRQTDQPVCQGEGTDAGIASPLVESWPSTESSSLLTPEGEPGSEARVGSTAESQEMFRTDQGWSGSPQADPAESSIIAKYIQRFRHGKPLSREERECTTTGIDTDSSEFWWLRSSPPSSSTPTQETHQHHPDIRSLTIEERQSASHSIQQCGHLPAEISLPSFPGLSLMKTGLSSGGEHLEVSQLESFDLETVHLQERANRLLQRSESSCSGLIPVSSDGVGSPNVSDPAEEVSACPVSILLCEPAVGDSDVKHISILSDGLYPKCKPLFTTRPEDDILYQWRLQRKMEAARESSSAFLPQRKSQSPSVCLGRQIARSHGDTQKDKPVVTESYPESCWRGRETPTRNTPHGPKHSAGTAAACSMPIPSDTHSLSEDHLAICGRMCLQAGAQSEHCVAEAAEKEQAQQGRGNSGLVPSLSSTREEQGPVDSLCRQCSTGRGKGSSGPKPNLSSAMEGQRSADSHPRQLSTSGERTLEGVSADKQQRLVPAPDAYRSDCSQRGRKAHHGKRREPRRSQGLEASCSQPPVSLQAPVFPQPRNLHKVRPQQQDSCLFTGSSGSDTEQESSEGEHCGASPEDSSTTVRHRGKPTARQHHQRASIHQVLGQVVSERMFSPHNSSHQLRSKSKITGRARGHHLPPSPIPEAHQTHEMVAKLLKEAEESDGMEFEEDLLLRVLRQQRHWVRQQLREADRRLTVLTGHQH
ncbi:proline and serine-rich protein 3 isoform X2 [Stegostoma tigrinum]|uniref:proline and serine-rich protein 3 isoform X2 n=1 Tax=Stegostoma tigrinum TaxID=3053191 RepID=UPI00202B1C46|nr:proline and serine-rich protein 3 isoform X2 [Stegostoma tigrinum]